MKTLTMVLDVSGRDADEADGKAYSLVCATQRLLPAHGGVEYWLDEENSFQFRGDEDSLRLLYTLAEARQVTVVIDSFEEACGIEDGPRTRLGRLAEHHATA